MELTGSNKLCHWNGRIKGTRDNTTADKTPYVDGNYSQSQDAVYRCHKQPITKHIGMKIEFLTN